METLFIVKDSPFVIDKSLHPLGWVKEGDGVIFIHEGVYIAKERPENVWSFVKGLKDKGVSLYILEADVKARALKTIPGIFEEVNYEGFVDLITKYNRVF